MPCTTGHLAALAPQVLHSDCDLVHESNHPLPQFAMTPPTISEALSLDPLQVPMSGSLCQQLILDFGQMFLHPPNVDGSLEPCAN